MIWKSPSNSIYQETVCLTASAIVVREFGPKTMVYDWRHFLTVPVSPWAVYYINQRLHFKTVNNDPPGEQRSLKKLQHLQQHGPPGELPSCINRNLRTTNQTVRRSHVIRICVFKHIFSDSFGLMSQLT